MVVTAALALLVLALLNDGFVATRVERFEATGKIDLAYLADLSAAHRFRDHETSGPL